METKEELKNNKKAKSKGYEIWVLRIVLIAFLLFFLILSYFFTFSSSTYASFFGYKLDGTFSAKAYYGANDCDLIVIEAKEINELKDGDIVCYYNNLERGSGRFMSVRNNHVWLEKEDGTVISAQYSSIIGIMKNHIAVLGLFLKFVSSIYGIILFNILLVAYISYITLSRI